MCVPRDTGWTLKVKATRPAPLRGGVLADAVGAGKTIVAIALIASRAAEARAGVAAAPAHDLQYSGATLVVAPVFSLKPVWKQLLSEFTSGEAPPPRRTPRAHTL